MNLLSSSSRETDRLREEEEQQEQQEQLSRPRSSLLSGRMARTTANNRSPEEPGAADWCWPPTTGGPDV